MATDSYSRTDVQIPSEGERLAAWLYRPEADRGVPCVVLAHGFGGTRAGRLDAYAERFAAAGYAALVFDYRHFGDSSGEPRQLLDIGRQLADWRNAVTFARELDGVDPGRIALWGSSFSGGHVIRIAAGDPRVAAVISQVPFTSGPAALRAIPPAQNLKLAVAALRDAVGAVRGREPVYVGTVGPPGALAAMTSPDADPGYRSMFPSEDAWRNEVAARIFLRVGTYMPGRSASKVACPLLVQVARDDAITPPGPARRAAKAAPRGELVEYDLGHFGPYLGEPFERSVGDQLEFLGRHLPVRA